MYKAMIKISYVFFLFLLFSGNIESVYSQDNENVYSILFGWKTQGSINLLARRATAFNRLKGAEGIAINFGSILGPTGIVQYDEGSNFLAEASNAGIDYVVPASSEFLYGVEVFKRIAGSDRFPRFISANLVDEKTRETLVDPYAVWNISGLRICIIAMSDINTVRDAPDANVQGIDVISYDDALEKAYEKVASEYADLIVVAGRMDRNAIMNMAVKYPFVDFYVTNNQSGGFSDSEITTTTIHIAGKPVYIGPESNDHLGFLNVKEVNGIESREFADITLGEQYPPDKKISSNLHRITEILKKKDTEESFIVKTGSEVASVLKEVFKVDAVLLERQGFYYYPLKDSLTVLNVREVIKPGNELIAYYLNGYMLKSVWEQNKEQTDPELRLVFSGISDDGKVNSLPIQDDNEYSVLISRYLRLGGNNYDQFKYGKNYIISSVDMLEAAESYLVVKEEHLRELVKEKIWELSLNLSLNSNFDRTDVDADKDLYGNKIPKPFRNMVDKYSGNFIINSQNNKLTMNKTKGKNVFENYLRFSYKRMGYKTHEKEGIQYNTQRNQDEVELMDKYTYDLPSFPVKPYAKLRVLTFLYSGGGKHPITGILSAGGTRTFKKLLGLNVALGLSGTRNYYTLENSFGTASSFTLNRKFPAGLFFSKETEVTSETNIYWNPSAKYHMEFKLDSYNNFKLQIWNRIHADLTVKMYSYRNTIHRKVAVGFQYLFTLNYNMSWKF